MEKVKNKKGILGKVALVAGGAAVGAAAGVLFAPRKGSETRALLKSKIEEFGNHIKKLDSDALKTKFERKLRSLEKEIANLDKEKAVAAAKKKADSIRKKADDLVDLAIKKGNESLENAASEVREKAIAVTKSVLKRLESSQK